MIVWLGILLISANNFLIDIQAKPSVLLSYDEGLNSSLYQNYSDGYSKESNEDSNLTEKFRYVSPKTLKDDIKFDQNKKIKQTFKRRLMQTTTSDKIIINKRSVEKFIIVFTADSDKPDNLTTTKLTTIYFTKKITTPLEIYKLKKRKEKTNTNLLEQENQPQTLEVESNCLDNFNEYSKSECCKDKKRDCSRILTTKPPKFASRAAYNKTIAAKLKTTKKKEEVPKHYLESLYLGMRASLKRLIEKIGTTINSMKNLHKVKNEDDADSNVEAIKFDSYKNTGFTKVIDSTTTTDFPPTTDSVKITDFSSTDDLVDKLRLFWTLFNTDMTKAYSIGSESLYLGMATSVRRFLKLVMPINVIKNLLNISMNTDKTGGSSSNATSPGGSDVTPSPSTDVTSPSDDNLSSSTSEDDVSDDMSPSPSDDDVPLSSDDDNVPQPEPNDVKHFVDIKKELTTDCDFDGDVIAQPFPSNLDETNPSPSDCDDIISTQESTDTISSTSDANTIVSTPIDDDIVISPSETDDIPCEDNGSPDVIVTTTSSPGDTLFSPDNAGSNHLKRKIVMSSNYNKTDTKGKDGEISWRLRSCTDTISSTSDANTIVSTPIDDDIAATSPNEADDIPCEDNGSTDVIITKISSSDDTFFSPVNAGSNHLKHKIVMNSKYNKTDTKGKDGEISWRLRSRTVHLNNS